MARFKTGWVKIWRKAALGDINSNYTRGGLFNALVAMANIQNSTVSWKGKPRKLEPGEIVTSTKELAELGDVDRGTVLRHLNYLVLRGTLSLEKSNKGTLIKIINFKKYQLLDAEGPHQAQQQAPQRAHIRHYNDITHIEELKNKRIKKVQLQASNDSAPRAGEKTRGLEGEIENIYLTHYPRKKGKKEGLKKLGKEIKTPAQLVHFKKAVLNYVAECQRDKRQMKHVLLFSTFANRWDEFIEPEAELFVSGSSRCRL